MSFDLKGKKIPAPVGEEAMYVLEVITVDDFPHLLCVHHFTIGP